MTLNVLIVNRERMPKILDQNEDLLTVENNCAGIDDLNAMKIVYIFNLYLNFYSTTCRYGQNSILNEDFSFAI